MFPLYYLFSIMFLTTLLFILSSLFKKYFLFVLLILMVISYIIQYSNYYRLLDDYNYSVRLPLLDTLSFLPLSAFGIFIHHSKIIEILKENKAISLFLSGLFLYFLFKYDIFVNIGGYKGFIHIFSSLSFFVQFYLLPLENINPLNKLLIEIITSYTNGIYCLQSRMIVFVKSKIYKSGTLMCSIIIYFLLYLVSFLGIKLFGKTRLKYLFI